MAHSRRSRSHDFDGAMKLESMERQILKYLYDHYTSPSDAQEAIKIAKGVGKNTKKDINKFLYSLQKKGFIKKVVESPPTWQLVSYDLNADVSRQPASSTGYEHPTTSAFVPTGYSHVPTGTYVGMAAPLRTDSHGPSTSRNVAPQTGTTTREWSSRDPLCETRVKTPVGLPCTADFPSIPGALLQDATSRFSQFSLKDRISIRDVEHKVLKVISNNDKLVVEEICAKIPECEIEVINRALQSLLAKNSIQAIGGFYSLPPSSDGYIGTTVPKAVYDGHHSATVPKTVGGDTSSTVPKVIYEGGDQDPGRVFARLDSAEETFKPSCFAFPSFEPVPTAPPPSVPLGLPEGKNAISLLNELAQNKHRRLDYIESMSGPDHKRRFMMTVDIGDRRFRGPEALTKKEAKLKAAEVALAALYNANSSEMPSGTEDLAYSADLHVGSSIHDRVAAMVMQKYNELAQQLPDMITGRKIVAGFVKSRKLKSGQIVMQVVSVGSGNRCVMGDKLSMQGMTVNDCHAEVIARRGLVRYIYRQLLKQDPEFVWNYKEGRFVLIPEVEFHLYISTAPCGDSAIFAPSDIATDQPGQDGEDRSHHPLFENRKQGVLRTKIENGEGCIPIEEDTAAPTWDGILRGERLRTMSCSDKIAKWNFLGLQGSLLSHVVKPIYMSTLTLGMLYNHGHLTRAVCCRVQKAMDSIARELLPPTSYKVHHPVVNGQNQMRETGKMKTREFSLNWCLEDSNPEVLDGTEGKCEPRFQPTTDPPRICKAELFKKFKEVCRMTNRNDLSGEGYYRSKIAATGYQNAKSLLWYALEQNGFGKWMPKPKEEKDF